MTSDEQGRPRPRVGAQTTRRLDHLPVVASALNRLGVRRVIDELVPKDPRSHVSTGECIEVLVTAILLGSHTLYRVADLLRPYDLRAAFGFELADPRYFNDERLAKALTDLFHRAGVDATNSALLLSALREYDLQLGRLHLDTTSVSVHGDYPASTPPPDADDSKAIPHVTRGHSKDRRPDLKQIVYGLSVQEEGVPVFGRVSSGNRADSLELRHMLERLQDALPSPEDVLYVGDSKLFSAETVALITARDLKFVTLLPRTFNLWDEAYQLFLSAESVPRLKEKALGELDDDAEEDTRPRHYWYGRSFDMTHEFAFDSSHYSVDVRALVVESDALKARKDGVLRRRQEKERLRLEKLTATHEQRVYSCEADARRALERLRGQTFSFHRTHSAVAVDQRRKKRARRGRPPKDEAPEFEDVWRIAFSFEADPSMHAAVLRRETCFVLITNVPVSPGAERKAADQETLAAYDGQDVVERAFRWAKRPLRFAPVFLEREDRIAALGLVYVIALMVYALIQRDTRQRLRFHQTTMPGNKRWTDRPTAEVVFRLFENINTLTVGEGDEERVHVTGLNTEQVRILELLDIDLRARPWVEFGEIHTPRPGERAFKPVPRKPRSQQTL